MKIKMDKRQSEILKEILELSKNPERTGKLMIEWERITYDDVMEILRK